MSVQFCFNVNNPKKVKFDIEELKKFVSSLYIGDKEPKFSVDGLPFVLVYDKKEDDVCILMISKGQKNIERINTINENLKISNLRWKNNITLGTPFLYEEVQFTTDIKPKEKKADLWKTLEQRGPYFTHLMVPYNYLGSSLIYGGKSYKLTPQEEKVAAFYAKRLISERAGGIVAAQLWATVPVGKPYRTNFWNDFQTYLTPEHRKIFKDLAKINWDDLIEKIENMKKDGLTVEEKTEKKIRDEERKREYGFAKLDGKREAVGNYTVEPSGIFEGRGKNQMRGHIKREIIPEDIILNLGEKDPIPIPPVDHNWGGIVHDHKAEWLAKYKDSISNEVKYVRFDAKGKFKGESDLLKYATARKLEKHIQTVRTKYMVDASSTNITKKQLGTVLYLIDHYGLRVGGEKGEDETDTVGATTLRVEHIQLKPPNHVIFDFPGKDSIRFYKDLIVLKLIYDNFQQIIKGKKGEAQVFDLVSSKSINIYLHEFDRNFTAKVFRTRLASSIMFEALQSVKIPKSATKIVTTALFNVANARVAVILNHTKNISKKAEESVQKEKDKLKELKKELASATETKQESVLNKIRDTESKINSKTNVLSVAIGTSLQNYIDPRMIVSWSLRQNCNLSAIYSPILIKKFKWAIDSTESNWNWLESPLAPGINPELEPSESDDAALSSEDESPSTTPTHKSEKGTIEDYKLLLEICQNLTFSNLSQVSKNAILWIYPFAEHALKMGQNPVVNRAIIRYYIHTSKIF